MPGCFLSVRQGCALALLFALSNMHAGAQGDGESQHPFPTAETLHYSVEWHMISAGTALLRIEPTKGSKGPQWDVKVQLESIGVVSKLYKLDDKYTVHLEDQLCATSSDMDSSEGKKHHNTKVTYDRAREHATYVERDLVRNTTVSTKETPIPGCVADVISGLYKLRTMQLQPGQSVQIPTSDGRKSAQVRIEAQEREEIKNRLGRFKTIRYEAFIFNGVIYSKKARMFVWLTDDARRLPVQIRARMAFPIGSITLELEKDEHL
jgi:Protein of unknown function (DUF3108)